ncbi:hypothetical protein L2E82_51055 [Cichorium intybus]|nr:hypothetical protein L2E82_51055 [Cichorium intybus]
MVISIIPILISRNPFLWIWILKSNLVSIHTLEINETIKEDDGINQKSTRLFRQFDLSYNLDSTCLWSSHWKMQPEIHADSQFALENYKVKLNPIYILFDSSAHALSLIAARQGQKTENPLLLF